MKNYSFAKTIWSYWHQGHDNLPPLVQECLASWQRLNPSWNIITLDQSSISDYLTDLHGFDKRTDLGLQMLTDCIRIKLLLEHGGVWVDASLFCSTPLDNWLAQKIDDDFFAFSSHRTDRLMVNWFLAGGPNSKILRSWWLEIKHFWENNRFQSNYWRRQTIRKLISLRKRNLVSNRIWFSCFLLNFVKAHPYPINMYLFEKALDTSPILSNNWHLRPKLFDTPAEQLQNDFGTNNIVTDKSKDFLLSNKTPVHKLNWRHDLGEIVKNSNLHQLIEISKKQMDLDHKP